MSDKIASLSKTFAAFAAHEQFFIRVDSNVTLEISSLCKPLLADLTSIWPLPSMNAHVTLKIASKLEFLSTLAAQKHLLFRVNSHVPLEITTCRKLLLTDGTFIWLLPSMNAHVALKITSLLKCLPALAAQIGSLLVMYPLVTFKSLFQ